MCMMLLKDHFFVRANIEDTYKLKGTSLDLYVAADFDRYRHSVQEGVITHLPIRITPRRIDENGQWSGYHNSIPLVVGDKVYFHHHVVTKDNEYVVSGERVYLCRMDQFICVIRDVDIIPLEEFFLADYIDEPESNFIKKVGSVDLFLKPTQERYKNVAVVTHVGSVSSEAGLYPGQVIRHIPMADYDFLCEGKVRLRMDTNQVMCELTENKYI